MFAFMKKMKTLLPAASTLPGRATTMPVPEKHFVNGNRIAPPFPEGMERAVFGWAALGRGEVCWNIPGVYSTGRLRRRETRKEPTYDEVCSADNHTEAVWWSSTRKKSARNLLQGVLGRPRPDAGHATVANRRGLAIRSVLRVWRRRS